MSSNISIESEVFLAPIIDGLRVKLRAAFEKEASKIVVEELAKFSLDIAKVISIQDFSNQIVLTIRKELK